MHQSFTVLVGRVRGIFCGLGLSILLSSAMAVDVNLSYLQGKMPVAPDAIAVTGTDLFGDKVNLYNGALEFEQTDMSLPGNNSLRVALTRRHVAGRAWQVNGQFGDWDLETPRIGGTFSNSPGWVTEYGGTNRCSGWSAPPTVARTAKGGGKADPTGENRILPTPPAPPSTGWAPVAPAA